MSARTRRGLVLTWTALFLCSLLMQYAAFAAPSPVLAVHDEGLLELDGNAANGAAAGDDWNTIFGGSDSADASVFITDEKPERAFEVGDKDLDDTSDWDQGLHNVPDKDDILHAFAALYGDIIYFGADRYSNDGDAQVGFWFFKNGIATTADGGFTPVHSVGDLLVVSHFTNGGTVSTIELYEWVGSGGSEGSLDLLATGQTCTVAPAADKACAIANSGDIQVAWSYQAKDGKIDPGIIPANAFYEGGLDLGDLYDGPPPCFQGFLVETRSSQEVSATLKDFATGAFETCEPPNISTQVSASSINVGDTVTDTADLTDNDPLPTGTIDFYVCGPSQSAQGCASTATQVGGSVELEDGLAESAEFTATAAGTYCFLAVYTPDAQSESFYEGGSHTNSTTECFAVLPAFVEITKTPDGATVAAGDDISFTLSWTNTGTGLAKGVVVTDELPAGADLDWSITSDPAGVCAISGAVGAEVLTCTIGNLAAGATGTVTVTSGTTEADCGVIDNRGDIDSTNDGSDFDLGDMTIVCPPDIAVVKVANPDDSVNAGDDIRFSVTISNNGTGVAINATASDTLPGGIDWAIDGAADGWSLVGGVLSFGPADLDPGESHTVTIVGTTDAADCGTVTNTATVDADNEPAEDEGDNSSTADVVVECPDIVVDKSADDDAISAGEAAAFSILITNIGEGVAYDVSLNDTLPGGVAWTLDAISINGQLVADPGALCSIAGTALTCADLGDVAPGDEIELHISGDTDLTDCGPLLNTVTIAASNEDAADTGNNTDSATVLVDCPDLAIDKDADHASPVVVGSQIGFTITIQNSGDGTAFGVSVSDTLDPDFTWSIASESGQPDWTLVGNTLSFAGDLPTGTGSSVHVVATSTIGDADQCGVVPNTAVLSHSSIDDTPASAAETVVCPDVSIEKDNDAEEPLPGIPTAEEGETVGYTIDYGIIDGPVTDAVITDVLPEGLVYVDGSASSDAQFTFDGYDEATRTLTWTADEASVDGTLTYEAFPEAGAADLEQPLVNVAEICAAEVPDCKDDDSILFVAEPPAGATATPRVTLPPTDTFDGSTQSNPGFGLMLTLLFIAGLALVVGLITPAPERVRRQTRR